MSDDDFEIEETDMMCAEKLMGIGDLILSHRSNLPTTDRIIVVAWHQADIRRVTLLIQFQRKREKRKEKDKN